MAIPHVYGKFASSNGQLTYIARWTNKSCGELCIDFESKAPSSANPSEPSTCTCTRRLRFILRLEKVFVCTSRHYSVGTTNYSDRSAHSMVSYEMHQQSDRGPATVVCDTCPARSRNFRSCIWRVHGPSQYPCRVPHRHLRCPNVPKQCAKALAIAH
jgi:hypothetical protein